MDKNGLNRRNVISIIPSSEDKNVQLRITDYAFDKDTGQIIVAAIYKDRSVTLHLHDDTLNENLYPNSLGKRFFYIDKHVFFLDNASDITGNFD